LPAFKIILISKSEIYACIFFPALVLVLNSLWVQGLINIDGWFLGHNLADTAVRFIFGSALRLRLPRNFGATSEALKNTDNVAITVKAFHCEPAGIGGLRSGISIKSF